MKSCGLGLLFPRSGNFSWFDWDFCWFVSWGFLGEGSVILCLFGFICLLVILSSEIFCPKSGFNVKLFYEG